MLYNKIKVEDEFQITRINIMGLVLDTSQKGEILIYQTEKEETKIDVYMEDGTICPTQKHITQLYGKALNTIYRREEELEYET